MIKRLSRREVYRNNWLVVYEDDILREDGSEGIFGVVHKPPGALIIATSGDQLCLVEQFRYPLSRRSWEFPMGLAPGMADMAPDELAALELRQETGLIAGHIEEIGKLGTAPGMCSQYNHVFLATDVQQADLQREHEEQDMRSAWFTRKEFENMIRDGAVIDAQTLGAYTLLKNHELKNHERS